MAGEYQQILTRRNINETDYGAEDDNGFTRKSIWTLDSDREIREESKIWFYVGMQMRLRKYSNCCKMWTYKRTYKKLRMYD